MLVFYAAVFVREDEEGAVQNRLEEWWISLMYKRDAELSRAARFLQGVARLTNRAFDSVLGKRLWSLQAVGASLWFSLASVWLVTLFMAIVSPHIPRIMTRQVVAPPHMWLSVIASIGLAILPSLAGRLWAFTTWALVVLIFVFRSAGFVLFGVQRYGYRPVLLVLAVILMMFLLSFGFDVLYISITRWMLRRMFRAQRLYELIGFLVLDVMLAVMLVYGPIETAGAMLNSPLLAKASLAILLVVMLNFGDFIACSVFFVVMLAVLAHRLMWPILERPIYALYRYGIIRNKKLLWGVGVALLVGPQRFIDLGKYIVQHV